MKYISIRDAAKIAEMEYERFRWWMSQGRGPKAEKILGRWAFIKEDVKKWKPVYSKNRGGNRYGKPK